MQEVGIWWGFEEKKRKLFFCVRYLYVRSYENNVNFLEFCEKLVLQKVGLVTLSNMKHTAYRKLCYNVYTSCMRIPGRANSKGFQDK